jgi:putative transposase
MKDWQSLSNVRWDCKYHVVIISKYRHRTTYGEVRKEIGFIIRDLCQQKGIELDEGHGMADQIHLLLSIPPRFSVANTAGFLKDKTVIRIQRQVLCTKRMTVLSFWTAGYCVSTVGLD